MSTDLTRTSHALEWSQDQTRLVKEQICPDLTDGELALFAQVCQRTGLDVFAKQVYAIKRGGKMTIQTSIDGYRLVAQRSGRYDGQAEPEWCDADGNWKTVWLSNEPPAAARVGVYLKGADHPTWGVARWTEYAQPNAPMWKKMPSTMLAKCAESQALRKAFPAELSGLYTTEEMQQAESPPVKLNEQQTSHLLALMVQSGVKEKPARARLANLTAAEYNDAVAATEQRIRENAVAAQDVAAEAPDVIEVEAGAA